MDKLLRPKYSVYRIDEKGDPISIEAHATDPEDVDSPFVLMPRKDPAAFAAMIAYARYCEPQLSAEIREWLRSIADADFVLGTQGQKNYKFMRLKATNDII